VVACVQCGHDNGANSAICAQCGAALDEAHPSGSEGATTRRVSTGTDGTIPRWGTASLGAKRQLLLHVRGYERPLAVGIGGELELGRADVVTGWTPAIALDDYQAAELGVSRRHAALVLEDDALKIVDLGSSNATFLNGQKLIPGQLRILRDGDELRLGKLIMRVQFA
jgi:pSer/pThr/pTyr-binding forkhead associated (FHA) protein